MIKKRVKKKIKKRVLKKVVKRRFIKKIINSPRGHDLMDIIGGQFANGALPFKSPLPF